MRFPLTAFLRIALILWAGFAVQAQELEVQPTPFTTLIDFGLLQNPAAKAVLSTQALPIWLESVQIVPNDPVSLDPAQKSPPPPHTVFRLRLRPMPGLNDSLLLRLFFDDRPDAHPIVSAWSDTGDQRFVSPPLGAGLELPASESLTIATRGVDYLEIDVPGDGKTVHQALLSTLKKSEVNTALDFATPPRDVDPFGAATPAAPGENDTFLFGRVRATLEPGTVKLAPLAPPAPADASKPGDGNANPAPTNTVQFSFNLEAVPLIAMITFDILDADPAAPLDAWANGEPIGQIALQLPDLADPAYAGLVRPLEKMRFHYAGWVRCQKIIPGAALRIGENTCTLQLPANTGPVAIRAVELQLKNHWQKLDYTLAPF